MATKTKSISKKITKEEQLLADIHKLDDDISVRSKLLADDKKTRDNMIWQAQEQNITRAGRYALVPTVKTTRSIDMAAIWQWKDQDLLKQIAKVTLTDAERVFGKNRLEEVIIKTPSTSYKVIEYSAPGEVIP